MALEPVTSAVQDMTYDDLAYDASERTFESWKDETLLDEKRLRKIGYLIDKWRGDVPEELCCPGRGAFNILMRMKFADGGSAVARAPCPGKSMFPEEKVQREVSVMRF
ncbi:hypothetical protein AJ79_04321 [Helicocarpus griseus UAMH5409]|uniref:Aminoglycoside phosphotransferase domain-containing protein n=1 Tax=Helicocarpus griseus UAMH5409 TaxID=1447875 RepID=A0A2B7XUD5_9EURO|nr:hypothetical protein AJ79_04321 [Helicocarpus griseus UAMH5409]